jgi:hypothetical protein
MVQERYISANVLLLDSRLVHKAITARRHAGNRVLTNGNIIIINKQFNYFSSVYF